MVKVEELYSGWTDISVPLSNGMLHWPGEPEVSAYKILSIQKGDPANVTGLSMSAHTATHMDAPRHFIEDGKDISQVPLEAVMGSARVIEIRSDKYVGVQELKDHRIEENERILLKTRNSEEEWFNRGFTKEYVALMPEAAKYLTERKIKLVGIDFLSIGTYEGDAEVHKVLLGSGIWIIEGLNLKGIGEGRYELICLPIRLMGADGAPSRAIVRRINK
ncbi:MAG: cyclase family protein [Ignavibacteriales bacterium]